ncbi:hypothetical protein MXB_5260 [Myxobolus squamalis]|nr:hypothetical protein MXB_5260 [Myxobolus squamalis]
MGSTRKILVKIVDVKMRPQQYAKEKSLQYCMKIKMGKLDLISPRSRAMYRTQFILQQNYFSDILREQYFAIGHHFN